MKLFAYLQSAADLLRSASTDFGPNFTVLLVTSTSDVRFVSNLRRSSSFFMKFHLILKIIKSK
jgi:hypothetical protein